MKTIEQIIEEQFQKWQIQKYTEKAASTPTPVITISREPGSGGRIIAKKVADAYELDLFHQEVIHQMAENTKISTQILKTLDEKVLSVLEDYISSTVHKRHLWPNQYLKHLMKIIGAIGKHGKAVVVGRGANFILPPHERFRVRIVAPREMRVQNVARTYNVASEDARRRIMRTESDRLAFIRKYFYADIADPSNYDLVINMANLSIAAAVSAIGGAAELPRSRMAA
jgi:cytidylate kinase